MKAYRIFMVSVIIVLLTNLALKSCEAKPRKKQNKIGVTLDPRTKVLKPYIDEYFINKYRHTKNGKTKYEIRFRFVDNLATMFNGEVGQCNFRDDSLIRIIKLDVAFWKKSNEIDRRALVHHELAHCDLNYDHDSSDVKNIMHPYIYDNFTEELLQARIKEMFLKHTKILTKRNGESL